MATKKVQTDLLNKSYDMVDSSDFNELFRVFNNFSEYHGFKTASLRLEGLDNGLEMCYIRFINDSDKDRVLEISLQLMNGYNESYDKKDKVKRFNVYAEIKKGDFDYQMIIRDNHFTKEGIKSAFDFTKDYLLNR